MSSVLDHLADLTEFRNRDALDASLVAALREMLQPLSVALYRCIGEPGQQRWLTRARVTGNELVPQADPLWAELGQLPVVADHPLRLSCAQQQRLVSDDGPPARTWFPLCNEAQSAAVLEIESVRPLHRGDERLVSSILRVYRNFQDLLDYSERDSLTGLLNRKTFDESFLRVAALSVAEADPHRQAGRRLGLAGGAWLAVIDIDHFKRVNDRYGHLIGDEVLLLLSRLMRSTFRHHDHVYRFGGEEFVALIGCDGADDARAAFERLRRNVESCVFPQVGQITVSAGYTRLRPGDTPTEAFERADKAVYHGKQTGRNRVVDFADLLAAGLARETRRDSDVELF